MSQKTCYIGALLTIAITAALLLWRLPDFPQHANARVIEPYGDGYKAYATYLYHIHHDSTHTWFEGMNYPYGEHVIPSDTQPLLSNSVRVISRYFGDISGYALGIFNYSMLLGVLLCSLFLYLIFSRLGLPAWYSVPIAVALAFLSPQFWRMVSHFGLAHPEVLPVLLYLLLRFDEKPSWRISAWIAFSILVFAQLHFYYLAIMGMTIGMYFAFRVLRHKEWRRVPLYAAHVGLQVLVPAGLFFLWMSGGPDDRTAQPVGFLNYRSIWEGVFTSLSQPHWRWVDRQIIKIEQSDYEGLAYAGMAVVIAIVIMIVRLIGGRFRKPVFVIKTPHADFLHTLFWASVVIVLFSFGHPFNIPGLEGLLAYAGPLKQFRSIGRFAWVFFYVGNIVAFMWLYSATRGRYWQPYIMSAAIALLAFEAWHFNRTPDLRLDEIEEYRPGQQFTDVTGIDFNRYQGILTVPYFNIGSDNLGAFGNDGFVLQKSLTLSLQTGLPTTSAMLTRTSHSQTLKQFQLMSEPYRVPNLLAELPDRRPFLLVVNSAKLDDPQVRRLYGHHLDGATLLYEKDILQIFEIPLELFEQRIVQRREALTEAARSDSLFASGPFLINKDNFTFVYENFDDKPAARTYLGAGAYAGEATTPNTVFDGTIPGQWPGGKYHFSAWIYVGEDLAARTRLDFSEYVPATGEEYQKQTTWVFFINSLVETGGWTLIEFPFVPVAADSRIRFTFTNKAMRRRSIFIDEMLIRAEAAEMYRLDEKGVWYNNRWFPATTQ
jgi:hypothetical protein